MKKNLLFGISLKVFTCLFFITNISLFLPAQTVTISPDADAYVRDGSYADTNFGSDTSLIVKSSCPFPLEMGWGEATQAA